MWSDPERKDGSAVRNIHSVIYYSRPNPLYMKCNFLMVFPVFLGSKLKDSPLRNTTSTLRKVTVRLSDPTNLEFDLKHETVAYPLDVEKAVYFENYSDAGYTLKCLNVSVFAHRRYRNLLVTQLEVDNTHDAEALHFSFSNNAGRASSDVNMTAVECPSSSLANMTCESGWTQLAEHNSSLIRVVSVHFASANSLSVQPGQSLTYLYPTVLLTSLESDEDLSDAVELFEQLYSVRAQWLEQHLSAWASIWKEGRIDIVGNDSVAAAVYSSMYYIMSSLREDWTFGLSPGSLSSDDYFGRTFWDQVSASVF